MYEATPEAGGPPVAVKVARLDREGAARRLHEEVRVLSEIGPPHVPAVLARGEGAGGVPYFVMERAGGLLLSEEIVDAPRGAPIAEVVTWAIAIARALEAVHARGYVHRDLKPEHIFIDAQGRATLIDFGLAIPSVGDGGVDLDDAMAGTAEYMSPEQCEGRTDIDARADIYSLGVILYELIAGRPPFWGSHAAVREMHLSHRPVRVTAAAPDRAIPPALDHAVMRCLAKDRAARFATARDLRAALEGIRPAPDAPPASSSRASQREPSASPRKTMGLVLFETDADLTVVEARLRALGGLLAYSARGRYAAVFSRELSDNPVRRALLAAEQLVRWGVCPRACVDLAPVTVQKKKDGTRRFLSPIFARSERYPAPGDPPISIASDAASVLSHLDPEAPVSGAGAYEGAPPLSRPGAAPSDAWPLFGRDALVSELVRSARRCATERSPAVVTVTAAAGLGKSRLFRELAERLAELEPQMALIALRAREPVLGDADRTLVDLLQRAQSVAGGPPSAAGPDARRARGPRSFATSAALALALGRASPQSPGGQVDPELRSLGTAPGALRSAMVAAAGDVLRRGAAERPLAILIDDAQFAGEVSLGALEYAALAEAGAPIWVCVLGRPELTQERPGYGDRSARRESHALGPLDLESAEALCRALLAPVESVPDQAVQRLVARAQATPLLLVELVRGLHRDGVVRRDPRGDSFYLATDELDRLPDLPLVEWLAQREIEGLAPALRAHAQMFALLGDLVTEAEVEGVLRWIEERGGSPDLPLDASVATRRLAAAGVIVEGSEGRFGYRHALVREAVARGAPEDLRLRVHLAASDYYRDAETTSQHHRLSQLARHASAAGLAEESAYAYFWLAEQACACQKYVDAERLYSRVLEQPGLSASDRAAAQRGRGRMRYRIGRHHDALSDLTSARESAEAEGDEVTAVEILLEEATALDWTRDFVTSEARVLEAQRRMPAESTPLLQARLLVGLGRSALRLGRNDEAVDLLERAAAAADELGDEGYEPLVIALLLLGFHLPSVGRLERARRVLEDAVTVCERHGDRLHLGAALNNRGLLWGCAGDKDQMIADLTRSLAIARELGQGWLELLAEANLGETLLLMGDAAAAALHIARAIALDLRVNGHPGRPVFALLEARRRYYVDDVDGAAELLARIRERQTSAAAGGDPDALMEPSWDLLCRALEAWAAGADASTWDELEEISSRVSVGQERIEIIEARACSAQRRGAMDEARGHLARAMVLASHIPNAMSARLARRLSDIER